MNAANKFSRRHGRFSLSATLLEPAGYVDGLNLYEYIGDDPTSFVDPLGLAAAATEPTTQPAVPTFNGFDGDRYQKHDPLIDELVRDFNANKQKYCGCTDGQVNKVGDLDPAVVKAWMIQESGGNDKGSRAAWEVDPTQVNVPGDWTDWKKDVGLTKPKERNEGDVRTNLTAALKWLCRKGFGGSGQPPKNRADGFFDGWERALQRYGPPNRRDFYWKQIWERAHNPGRYVPIEAG